jgi:hypothetical protein
MTLTKAASSLVGHRSCWASDPAEHVVNLVTLVPDQDTG